MKTLIVDDEIKCKPTDVFDPTFYPMKNGIYIVDDGTLVYFITVDHDTSMLTNVISSFPLPRKCTVSEYERIGERDIDLLQKQLSDLNFTHKAITNTLLEIVKLINDKPSNQNPIDLAGLTKLIAVAQKPDLLKGK